MTAPTLQQKQAIETQGRALLVDAGAGTGKTWVLVERFMHLLETHPDWPLESLVAVTFTEKATREMRSRIREAVERKALSTPPGSYWHARRGALERLQISTIHGLCARLLRENALAAEIDPRFAVLDAQEADLLQQEAVHQALAQLAEEEGPALDLLAILRVSDLRRELASLLAQRGTVRRLFDSLPEPAELLTRWQAAVEAMRRTVWVEILGNNPDLSAILDEIRFTAVADPDDKLALAVVLAQTGTRLLAADDLGAAGRHWLEIRLVGGRADNWGGKLALADLKAKLGQLRDAAQALDRAGGLQEVGPADELAARNLHLWRGLWVRIEAIYAGLKDERSALDFDDLEIHTERLLAQSPRSERLRAALDEIRHLLVDEFQDTNETQGRIVYALAPPDDPGRLFVVGDAKQSIYRFRQAQVAVFNRTKGEIETATGHPPVRLSHSFRSHRGLLEVLNQLFEQVLRPASRSYEAYEARPGPLSAEREAPPDEGRTAAPVEMLLLPAKDDQDQNISAEDARIFEAQLLADRLMALQSEAFPIWDKNLDGGSYRPFQFSDAAILFRATTSLPLYEAEFKKAGLPYLTVSGRGFYDRPEVQDLIALLTALYNPADNLSLATALRSPLFSLDDESLYRLRWHAPLPKPGARSGHPASTLVGEASASPSPDPPFGYAQALDDPPLTGQPERVKAAGETWHHLREVTGRVDVWKLLRCALDLTGYEAGLALADQDQVGGGRQLHNVQKFLALARERGGVSLSDFLRRIQDLRDREAREGEAIGAEPGAGAVQLMSIHAAKGLEFPVVALADLGRRQRRAFGSPLVLHDPAFGLVCKYRDENGDWQEPASYAWGKWLDGRMEAAEGKRLLYVACTRAADLLILSGKVGTGGTWLADIMETWEIDPSGAAEEMVAIDGFQLRVRRAAYEPAELPDLATRQADGPGLAEMPLLARPIALPGSAEPSSVTAAAAALAQESEEGDGYGQLQLVLLPPRMHSQDSPTPASVIGRIVHHALADWDCLALQTEARNARLAAFARRQGVLDPDAIQHAVGRASRMLDNLRRSSLYDEINQAQARYPELPFTFSARDGLLHGVIDLLYQDPNGRWHLIDWKTEWAPRDEIADRLEQHGLQLAVYAEAVRAALGEMPELALCFLNPRLVQTRLTESELQSLAPDI